MNNNWTVTSTSGFQKPKSKIKYLIQIAKWMFKHRNEPDNRQKWRRMGRELREVE